MKVKNLNQVRSHYLNWVSFFFDKRTNHAITMFGFQFNENQSAQFSNPSMGSNDNCEGLR